jgi:Ran GTPase-activating protein (RanGAP) involved in mRNA processing and transport
MSRKEHYRQLRLQEENSERQKRFRDAVTNSKSHIMSLCKFELEDADMEIVVEEVIKKKQCTALILEDNKITADGLACIIDALKSGASLKRLRLSSNPIGDDGAALLADLLHEKPDALTDLWMNDTALTNRGVQLLMEALEHPHSTLGILDLSDNKNVTDESLDGILEMLMVNKKLRTLRYNNILSQKAQNHLNELYSGKVTTGKNSMYLICGTIYKLFYEESIA